MNKGRDPNMDRLGRWEKDLAQARAVATVHSFMAKCEVELNLATERMSEAGFASKNLRRMFEQRLTFMGVYGTRLSLEEAFERLMRESQQQLESLGKKAGQAPGSFFLAHGVYDDRHAELREATYPYRPACSSRSGDTVINCLCTGTEELAGYLALTDGSYADDLSVHPRFHGRRVAKALVCGAATHLLAHHSDEMSLDVRACNLPAIELYKSVGFELGQRHYPGFYDWHGGYSMSASTKEVASHMPEGFDLSHLG